MANTEQLIDILAVIDAEGIMARYGQQPSPNARHPTSLGTSSKFIYMFVKLDEVRGGDASSNLNVFVSPNNIIRWRGTSLMMNTQFSVMLTACEISQGSELISPPQPLMPTVTVPVPQLSGNTLTGETSQTLKDFYFQSTAQDSGKVVYTYTFAITNNDGQVLGYFTWDPVLSSA